MYSEAKADKLIKEFTYLIGMPYYPFGEKGRQFTIKEIQKVVSNEMPEFKKMAMKAFDADADLSSGCQIEIVIGDEKEDSFKLTLIETLQALNIRHDIDKFPD